MNLNLLQVAEPASKLLPSIMKPVAPVTISEKTVFTALAVFIYLVCQQIPLYGIQRTYTSDSLYWVRIIMASSKGSLMQLGLSPIISAGWTLQFLRAFKLIKVITKKDAKIYKGLDKTLALIFCFGEGIVEIWYGAYGPPSKMTPFTIAIILAQLLMSGVIIILLDEMLRKGYGLGSGISLFIIVNTSSHIFWSLFSPITLATEYGIEFEGALICLVHFLMTKKSKWSALVQAFTRSSAPNLSSLTGTILIFLIVIYLKGFRLQVPLIHQQTRGFKTNFSIKLFYTSTFSVILQSALISRFYVMSSVLYSRFGKLSLVRLLGVWEGDQIVGGLAWYISPPNGIYDAFVSPFRFFTYLLFISASCALFARIWMVLMKATPRQIAGSLKSEGFTLQNYQEKSVISVLQIWIPTAAMLGGIVIGLLNIFGQMLNVFGSSSMILISVTVLYGYYKKLESGAHEEDV